ncbi:hypothetical protein M409DRAFT_60426 [Zasmidium cellare ATCC 36951]|uniref:Heterokaryon incompatibility domain-containing protein n=1 Tax=Zasmidium cellare ATCC 36951 TaxID=1080233 RepID=A0A6A6BYF5_ZASCE|nr:uncharacterized protein M409DRAFT_60426 [Zasmidium cellare ATCC 36951]KAF2159824.1 hypothetical protein M409DRAFT_60426 [Zasmidium cellare ATCC 36951]
MSTTQAKMHFRWLHSIPSGSPVQPDDYPPVDIEPSKEIRLLDLLPGRFDDEIHCKLLKHALNFSEPPFREYDFQVNQSELAYEAVSYAWGSPKDVVAIQLDGHGSFLVTRNLRAAFKRLRSQDSVRRLWADQICINQRNVSERNQQVAIMWIIFNEAAKVIVWLGEPGGPTFKLSKSFVEDLAKTPYADEMRYLIEHPSLHKLGSWWSRSWVVQEFVSARTEPAMYFGPHKLDWAVFGDSCWNQLIKTSHPETIRALFSVLTMGRRLADLRKLSHRGQTTILSLDWTLLQTECSDPRDKLYSLLGLLSQAERDVVTVDYAKDTRETFTIATQAFLVANMRYGILRLISFAGGYRTYPRG